MFCGYQFSFSRIAQINLVFVVINLVARRLRGLRRLIDFVVIKRVSRRFRRLIWFVVNNFGSHRLYRLKSVYDSYNLQGFLVKVYE